MSVTDRAFIKAYAPRQANAAPVAASHPPPDAVREAGPLAEGPAHAAPNPAGREDQLEGMPSAPLAPPRPGAAPLGTYGVSLSAPIESGQATPAPAVSAPAASLATAPAAVPELESGEHARQPLSSFTALVEVESALTPALEVEQFIWPETCNKLLSQAESHFDQWAAKLAQEAMNGHSVVMLAGLTRHEGRTTALLCLAHRLANAGVRTVLVDADFQKPGLAAALGVAVTTGWDEVLETGAPLQEALVFSRQDELTLLPLGEQVARPQQLARNLQAAVGLRALADLYDLVLVDAGPVLGSDTTATALMQQLDDVNLVLMRNVQTTPAERLAEAEQHLASATKVRLLGVAETFCPPSV